MLPVLTGLKNIKIRAVLCLLLLGSTLILATMGATNPASISTLPAQTAPKAVKSDFTPDPQSFNSKLADQPISFEANQGQFDPQTLFLARGRGYLFSLDTDQVTLYLKKQAPVQAVATETSATGSNQSNKPAIKPNLAGSGLNLNMFKTAPAKNEKLSQGGPSEVVRMQWLGANQNPRIEGREKQASFNNYYLGNDPANWRSNIPEYGQVLYKEVYPGIDLLFYGKAVKLEYDWVVGPGADLSTIRLTFEGASSAQLNPEGQLVLTTPSGGELVQDLPLIYQQENDTKKQVTGGYRLYTGDKGQPEVSFQVGPDYNPALPLTIDPTLVYSTYLGGSGGDFSYAITTDSSGNAFVTGDSTSIDLPLKNPYQAATGGSYDAFISEFDPNGNLLFSTYFGGSGADYSHGINLDSSGNIIITGMTSSTNFPLKNAYQATNKGNGDSFVAKFNSSGGLVYSTYYGGSGADNGYVLKVDGSGNAVIAGTTYSTDLPVKNAYQASSKLNGDSFVAKFDPNGGLLFGTYFGGSGSDVNGGVTVDATGNIFINGQTNSTDFPLKNASQATNKGGNDIYIAEFNASGGLLLSTYFGGTGDDNGNGIAVDSTDNIFVTGFTTSATLATTEAYQTTNNGGYDAFIAKFNSSGSLVLFSYFGGSTTDQGFTIGLDASGNIFISGNTNSTDLPVSNAYQATNKGGYDIFIAEFNSSGSLLFASYFGGSGDDFSYKVALDSGYALLTGDTSSTDFPTQSAYQAANKGGYDAFVVKFSFIPAGCTVTVSLDDGSAGTLSAALAISPACPTINFAPGVTSVTFHANHGPLPALKSGVNLQGRCGPGQSQVVIDGTGISGNGLTLSGNDRVSGIFIEKFGGRQIVTTGTGNVLNCVKANHS